MKISKKIRVIKNPKYGFNSMTIDKPKHFKFSDGHTARLIVNAAHASVYGNFTVRTVGKDDVDGPGVRVWKIK